MKELKQFVETVKILRDPKDGCPWDLEQTHASLKRYMLEESYECLEAIDDISDKLDEASIKNLKEELGDMLLQILLHSQIADDNGHFNIEDVAKLCNDKMRARHPHVFDDSVAKAESVDDVHKNWDAAKAKEKASRKSIFDGIPKEMPALARAWKISKKAVKESFEWDTEKQLWEQLHSELDEFKEAITDKSKEEAELEIGDILFTVVNMARWHKIDPEDALRKTNRKFIERFDVMTEIAKAGKDKKLSDYNSDELLKLWQEAKAKLA